MDLLVGFVGLGLGASCGGGGVGPVGGGVGCVALRCVWRDVGGCVHVCWVPGVGLVCVGVTQTVGGTEGSGDGGWGECGGEWIRS